MELYILSMVIKSSTALKTNKQRKSTLWFMQFNSPAAIQPTEPVAGTEKFYLEVGRKILFNVIFNVKHVSFPLLGETWKFPGNLEKVTITQEGSPCSHVLPQQAPRPLPHNDKHMAEVRGTRTAHGCGDKEISTLLRLKHTNKPAPRS